MTLEFKRLTEVDLMDIISLNNNPDVLRQMPLGSANFDLAKAEEWVQQKDAQWQQYGYGPWAFLIDQKFAGWGGLQYEEGDADLAMVLHPDFLGKWQGDLSRDCEACIHLSGVGVHYNFASGIEDKNQRDFQAGLSA